MPSRADADALGAYLITRLHWTNAPSRLNRDFGQNRFGDASYALEELVAAMLGATLQAPGNHIADWRLMA